jgi:predicted MFS family arabinose efflux permease
MGLFAGRLYQKINSKLLTLGALVALELSLALFILSTNKVVAYFCRFLTGICQVFLLVYYPIWIDKFGFKNKTLWLTLLQICVPVGIFAGYGMTSLVISLGLEVIQYLNAVQILFLPSNRYGCLIYHRVWLTFKK